MIKPAMYSGICPHIIEGDKLYFSKGNDLYIESISAQAESRKVGSYKAGFFKDFISRWDLPKRILRLGFHDLHLFKGGLVGIQHKAIVYKKPGEDLFKPVFTGFRGSRPLGLLVLQEEEKIYFGEYFGNNDRQSVVIYESKDLKDWKKAWEFPAGSIRHVHGLKYDSFRKGIWVLTGDSNQESGLWFTSDEFKTLDKVAGGDQRTRAVEVTPIEKGLIVPMDSPLEQNYINLFIPETRTFHQLASIPGSAFHSTFINGVYLVSTVTEPSDVNDVDYASVYASLDGLNWKELFRFKKDWFPVKYQFLTRYSEVVFCSGENSSDSIVAYGRALKYGSNAMLWWSKKEVIDFLQQ